MTMTSVAVEAELWEGELRGVVIARAAGDGSVPVLLVRVAAQVHAYADRCTHLGVKLSEFGTLAGTVLTCGAHHFTYDACTGCGINPPSTRLRTYPLEVRDGQIWVDVG
jgi:toluene monooxygenase system ferredoxin subunit